MNKKYFSEKQIKQKQIVLGKFSIHTSCGELIKMLLKHINKWLCKKSSLNFLRYVQTEAQSTPRLLFPLENKRLLKVIGVDAPGFLQGLITNDMRHFEDGARSIYAMFLNNKGRVLYDVHVHRWEGEDSFMIECDRKVLDALQKHFKIFKLKRLVNIEDVNKDYKLWVVTAPPDAIPELKVDPESSINIYKDSRHTDLGYKILAASKLTDSQVIDTIGKDIQSIKDDDGYHYLRYKLGISEGFDELPPGTRLPLEANCDYLHGVSFHKGCYIGQELLARVYFTGVIRKRIVPIKFDNMNTGGLKEEPIEIKANSTIGKLIGCRRDWGLALVRLKEAFEAKTVKVGDMSAEVIKPAWWPLEAPKEKERTVKTDKEK